MSLRWLRVRLRLGLQARGPKNRVAGQFVRKRAKRAIFVVHRTHHFARLAPIPRFAKKRSLGMTIQTDRKIAMSDHAEKVWVTLNGLPLTFEFEWPFHKSTSGADFWVLHGDIRIANSDGLHAPVAVNLSATVREVLPSLDPKDAEAPVINALRKEIDRKQIEFAKSGKLLPVAFSSRHYDFKRQKWVFGKAADDVIATFLERKVYWQTATTESAKASPFGSAQGMLLAKHARNGAPGYKRGAAGVWIGDPAEAQYLETTPGHLLEVAGRLAAAEGLIRMDGQWAEATSALMDHAGKFEGARQAALEELDRKHAFERG